MNTLFYHPTSYSDGYPEPPLGLGYLMHIVKKKGWRYEFFDEDHHSKFICLDEILKNLKPGLIVISFMTPQYYEVLKVIKKFKEHCPGATIIIGGPHATALPGETLKEINEIDFVCKGEGEKTFEQFLDYLGGSAGLEDINGLFYRRNGQIYTNAPRELMTSSEMDEHCLDWHKMMEYGPYPQKLSYRNVIMPVFPVITARGCPNHCTFCDEGNIWQNKVRMRSIDNVIKEISFLVERYNAKCFNILDDAFTLKKSRVIEFCERIKPLNIHFRITSTVKSVDEEKLSYLAQAGCDLISYGVESGDENVLRIMKKRQTIQDIKRAFDLTTKADILSYALCMVGNIGEDMSAVKRTASLLDEIKPDLASCSIMMPYPGSENYRICRDNGWLIHHNWKYWIPSILKTKGYKVVARTDKMDENELLSAYYYMNRTILINRFKHKYGRFFSVNIKFYLFEVFPRLGEIGVKAFLSHIVRFFKATVSKENKV
jgi:radical SAM superfamily enzyme YgiQ (UPF0313 family)